MKIFKLILIALMFPLSWNLSLAKQNIIASYGEAYLERIQDLDVLHLKGDDQAMGEQYGYLMGDRLEQMHELLIKFVGQEEALKSFPDWAVVGLIRAVGWTYMNYYSSEDKRFLKSMVKAAEKRGYRVNLYEVSFINSLIDFGAAIRQFQEKAKASPRIQSVLKFLGLEALEDLKIFTNMCDSFAAWGSRTVEGKTFQTRNTDIDVGTGLENFALVVIQKRNNSIPFVSAGFVGQFGAFTGLNASGVGLGQIWGFSKIVRLGQPWQLQMRHVFAEAKNASEAVDIFKKMGKKTYGSNFIFADANGQGYAVELNPKHYVVFKDNDPKEAQAIWQGHPYALTLKEAILRADVALDPTVRKNQTASRGPDGDPRLSGAYKRRYYGQYIRIVNYEKNGIKIGPEEAETISRETADVDSSLQTAVYANTDRKMWVSYASINPDSSITQAWEKPYQEIPFDRYLDVLYLKKDSFGRKVVRLKSWMPSSNRKVKIRAYKDNKKVFEQSFTPRYEDSDLNSLGVLLGMISNRVELWDETMTYNLDRLHF